MSRPELTGLYRFFSESDELLYVGISSHPLVRMGQHRVTKDWWLEVRHTTIEYFESREAALRAEYAAIKSESPRYNVVFAPRIERANTQYGSKGSMTIPDSRRRMDYIIQTWGGSLTTLGEMFGVTRQAVAKWRNRGFPLSRSTDMNILTTASDVLREAWSIGDIPIIVRQESSALGAQLIDIARGGDPETTLVACELVCLDPDLTSVSRNVCYDIRTS